MTGIELWDHADGLARCLGKVDVQVCGECDDWTVNGRAVIDGGAATVFLTHRPTSSFPYLLFMHELGHLAHQRGKRGFRIFGQRPRLRDEALAWQWALEHSAIEPTVEDWTEILERLTSYGVDRRYKRDEVFDELFLEALGRVDQDSSASFRATMVPVGTWARQGP